MRAGRRGRGTQIEGRGPDALEHGICPLAVPGHDIGAHGFSPMNAQVHGCHHQPALTARRSLQVERTRATRTDMILRRPITTSLELRERRYGYRNVDPAGVVPRLGS